MLVRTNQLFERVLLDAKCALKIDGADHCRGPKPGTLPGAQHIAGHSDVKQQGKNGNKGRQDRPHRHLPQ